MEAVTMTSFGQTAENVAAGFEFAALCWEQARPGRVVDVAAAGVV